MDTTEVFIGGQLQWSTVGPLPTAVAALAGVTIDNTVYMTGLYAEKCNGNMCVMLPALVSGGVDQVGAAKEDIWSYDAVNKVWVTTNMTLGAPNHNHAVTVIDSCPLGE